MPSADQDDGYDFNISPTFFFETYTSIDDATRQALYFGLKPPIGSQNTSHHNNTRALAFGSIWQDDSVAVTNCSVSSTSVESIISCNNARCGVTWMRRSLQDKRPSYVSPLDVELLSTILYELPGMGGSVMQAISSPLEIFLNDTSMAPYSAAINKDFVDISTIPEDKLSTRLSIVLNTYFQLSTSPGAFFGDLPTNLSLYGPDTTPSMSIATWFGKDATLEQVMESVGSGTSDLINVSPKLIQMQQDAPFVGATAHGNWIQSHEIFILDPAWVTVLFICTVALLVVGVAGAIINSMLVAPDMMGYVVSLTYNKSEIKGFSRDLPLEASDRARLLRKLKVRLGDVEAEETPGRIALTAHTDSVRLRRGKTYSR